MEESDLIKFHSLFLTKTYMKRTQNRIKSVSKLLLIATLFLLSAKQTEAKRPLYYYATLNTTAGEMTIRLYNETPLHRDNFIKLSKSGFFDGIIFHRVIDNFMIQCGDPESKEREQGKKYGNGGPGYNIPAEIVPGLYHKKGAVGAARMGDDVNPERESSGSQFYIVKGKLFDDETLKSSEERINSRNASNNISTTHTIPQEWREIYKQIGGTPHLDTQYTVFGELVSGEDVVEKISISKTDKNDRPLEDVIIISIKIKKSRKLTTK